jgi:hypothetical protein
MRKLLWAGLASVVVLGAGGVTIAAEASGSGSDPGPDVSYASKALTPNPVTTFPPNPAHTVYVPITTCQVVNTATVSKPIKKGKTRGFVVRGTAGFESQGGLSGGCPIPSDATSVTLLVTTSNQSAAGTLRIGPGDATPPAATAASFSKQTSNTTGETQFLSGPGASPDLRVRAMGATTDLEIDVTGYYTNQPHLIVLADGTLWYGTNHVVSMSHTANSGAYSFTMDQSLVGCNILTMDNDQNNVVATGSWGGDTVSVQTYQLTSGTWTHADESFQMYVVC